MSTFNLKVSEQIYGVKIAALMYIEVPCQKVSLHPKSVY